MSLGTPTYFRFLDLPLEIRLRIYEYALTQLERIPACQCANTIKDRPFLGNCEAVPDLRHFILDIPYALRANRQTYMESKAVALSKEGSTPYMLVGGTKCLTTFLKYLPAQHPSHIKVTMRTTVQSSWLQDKPETLHVLNACNSLIGTLGIESAKSYIVTTTAVRRRPAALTDALALIEVDLGLTMGYKPCGWLGL
ncbi:uncharacterized protein HMPREF1541_00555 [Cyphellophora europaea CBS 101466]|uniref:F-box domain-containing protein n=1 Tax=Cyphellophora europaea (strain CBS 101466) TaxID=1220924 RepID=W2SCE0_CYPE1|nr:uncharacterized protein HMPREF1541_00555 [Cyphellophora europaea CBS 101466]ETN46371.1 hypothetical protein HMPREF1541_00555 [Cyphellophora europaea CBS 101466]